MAASARIVLDTRRKKRTGLYPVKLRVYNKGTPEKLYKLGLDLSKIDFESIWVKERPRQEHKKKRLLLKGMEHKANTICSELNNFSFRQFERKFFRTTEEGVSVNFHYEQRINQLKSRGSISTAETYSLSLKSLLTYHKLSTKKEDVRLFFTDIDAHWLQAYEDYMTKKLKKSFTTVSIYLRALKAIYNIAIQENDIISDIYPFGKSKYQIPGNRTVKKALSADELKKLFNSIPETKEQIKAKAFWFFSYVCNGMNIKDIVQLRFENINNDKFTFYRAKTIKTAKTDLRPVIVYLTKHAKNVIDTYGNKSNTGLIFPIITDGDSDEVKYTKIKNFTKFINQHIKKLAKTLDITTEISTYWARHSFATTVIKQGKGMEFAMEALNHSNLKTTKAYFGGFEDKDRKEFAEELLNFNN